MSDSPDASIDQDAYLNTLRKELASYLAQKLTFSLFQAGKSAELKQRINDLVEEKLLADQIPLESAQKEKVINEIIAGMPSLQGEDVVAAGDVKDSDKFTLEELQDIMRPFLATRLDDSLFNEDRKADLVKAIEENIDDKIKMDAIPIAGDQRQELINAICSTMGLDPAAATSDSEAPASAPEVPNAPPLPDVADKKEEAPFVPASPPDAPSEHIPSVPATPKPVAPAVAKKKIPKAAGGSMLPLKALTHEIKRDLLYELSTKINPEVMASGDELAFRTEIFGLIQDYCKEHKFTLNDQDVEKIVQEILSGEGLEFQL
ncbi:MAG: hypothetical protein KTR33_16005 [Gammaproteobacteria bacterium]|nr:hypothetical protein [Gammaproteobacteria bacterium]